MQLQRESDYEGGRRRGGGGGGGTPFARPPLTLSGEGSFSVQVARAMIAVQTGMIGWRALAMSGPAQYTPRMNRSWWWETRSSQEEEEEEEGTTDSPGCQTFRTGLRQRIPVGNSIVTAQKQIDRILQQTNNGKHSQRAFLALESISSSLPPRHTGRAAESSKHPCRDRVS